MNSCSYDILLGPYHDKELSAARCAELESHLAGCPECAGRLAQMRRMSNFFSKISFEPINGAEISGLHRAVEIAEASGLDRAVLRIAVPLAALAASVLMVTSVWLANIMHGGSSVASTTTQLATAAPQSRSATGLEALGLNSKDRTSANLSDWMVRSLGGDTP